MNGSSQTAFMYLFYATSWERLKQHGSSTWERTPIIIVVYSSTTVLYCTAISLTTVVYYSQESRPLNELFARSLCSLCRLHDPRSHSSLTDTRQPESRRAASEPCAWSEERGAWSDPKAREGGRTRAHEGLHERLQQPQPHQPHQPVGTAYCSSSSEKRLTR